MQPRTYISVEGEDNVFAIASHREEGNYTVVAAVKKDGTVYKTVKFPTAHVKSIFTLSGDADPAPRIDD